MQEFLGSVANLNCQSGGQPLLRRCPFLAGKQPSLDTTISGRFFSGMRWQYDLGDQKRADQAERIQRPHGTSGNRVFADPARKKLLWLRSREKQKR